MTLGQPVTFSRTLKKVRDHNGKVTWVPVPHEPKSGVFVGYRTLAEGRVIWHEYTEFKRTGSVRAILVATTVYRNPVYVPREDLEA